MGVTNTKRASRDCGTTILTNLSTNKVALAIDYANSFTLNITSDTTPALKRGKKAIIFNNPLEGTAALELQVYPFELYSIFGNGSIGDSGIQVHLKSIKATEAGKLDLPTGVVSLNVYPKGSAGTESEEIKGTKAENTFTATTESDIAVGKKFDVIYTTTGGKSIKINDELHMPDYKLDTDIVTKNENGEWSAEHIICYKATPQRNIELAYNAEGDPATLTVTFDLLTDSDDEFVEISQISDSEDESVEKTVGE
jgi:hypothetical protein